MTAPQLTRESPAAARDAMELVRSLLQAGVPFVPLVVLDEHQRQDAHRTNLIRLAAAEQRATAEEGNRS